VQKPPDARRSLFALTGASNITNSKAQLSILDYASSLGYHTLLDAAALAPTTKICLAETGVDAMAVSFYKMFGYPSGVGALVAKKSFLAELTRPWFAGGTVDIVQVPGMAVTMSTDSHERFEVSPELFLLLHERSQFSGWYNQLYQSARNNTRHPTPIHLHALPPPPTIMPHSPPHNIAFPTTPRNHSHPPRPDPLPGTVHNAEIRWGTVRYRLDRVSHIPLG
jgi:hypothetical protein